MTPSKNLIYFREITLLAENPNILFRGIRTHDFFLTIVTFPLPQLLRIPHGHPTPMPLIRMNSRYRNIVSAVKFQFLRNNSERLFCGGALDGPVENVVGNFADVFWYLFSGDGFFDFLHFPFFISPSQALCQGLLPGHR